MKRLRLATPAALSILAVTASAAFAAATAPDTGSWASKKGESDDAVSFKVKKTSSGDYRATSTKVVVAAGCDAPNPNDSTTARLIKASGVTVKLAASGKQLKGSKAIKKSVSGGKATQTVKIAMTFTSATRAKVTVKGKYDTKKNNPMSNADDCSGSLKIAASPK